MEIMYFLLFLHVTLELQQAELLYFVWRYSLRRICGFEVAKINIRIINIHYLYVNNVNEVVLLGL